MSSRHGTKLSKLLDRLVVWYMQRQLNRLRKWDDTPYIFLNGTGKDYPRYLMYTDNKEIRDKMHAIP